MTIPTIGKQWELIDPPAHVYMCVWLVHLQKNTQDHCWFFTPIWKICASQIGSSPRTQVYKNTTHLKLSPGHSFVRDSPFRNIITRRAPTSYKDMTPGHLLWGFQLLFPPFVSVFFKKGIGRIFGGPVHVSWTSFVAVKNFKRFVYYKQVSNKPFYASNNTNIALPSER